jgi:glycosyltransferase involved in cell wall biosynthesis
MTMSLSVPYISKSSVLRSLQVGISWSTGGAGGSGRIIADLARYLPHEGVQVAGAVSAPDDVAEQTNGAIRNFAPAGSAQLQRLRGTRATICQLIAENPPDLIATHFALYPATILDRLKFQTHIVHFHGPWAAESKLEGGSRLLAMAKYQIERSVYDRADRMIVLSQAFADIAMRDYSVPAQKIRIVPGGVDVNRFAVKETRQQARSSLGWPEDKRILVSVRRLVNRMGLDRLISAMASISQADPDTILYIVGKGRLRTQLEEQVAALGLQQKVRFFGFAQDWQLPLIYRAADLNVVPTVALEGFGLIALEALAAGTPSMVTPVGGLTEVTAPLAPDLVFRSCSVQDIADGLIHALSGAIAVPDAASCQAYAQENYSVQLMAARTAEVYREACATH